MNPNSPDQPPPRVLCVDDDPNVLKALQLHLERFCRVEIASSGPEALEKLASSAPFAVVISDLHMPGMDGATFLGQVRQRFGDSVRILLSGRADLKAAIAAVNEGKIFHFLSKPCPPDQLLAAVRQAIEHNNLILRERALLDQTVRGSIQLLTEVLALTHPIAFGRAMRVRRLVAEMTAALKLPDPWQLDVAALLSQIGCLSLAAGTVEKLHFGHELTAEERRQVSEVPLVAARLLGNIPRLETVRAILGGAWEERRVNVSEAVRIGSQILCIASDYDTLEAQGLAADIAIGTLRGREGRYDPSILDIFARTRGAAALTTEIRELPLRAIRPGMVLLEDLYLNGTLEASRGYEITERFVERAQNWRKGTVNEPIRVIVPRKPDPRAGVRQNKTY
jgi:CheY-like chemotaxis protein